jgi:hypothetical protein
MVLCCAGLGCAVLGWAVLCCAGLYSAVCHLDMHLCVTACTDYLLMREPGMPPMYSQTSVCAAGTQVFLVIFLL